MPPAAPSLQPSVSMSGAGGTAWPRRLPARGPGGGHRVVETRGASRPLERVPGVLVRAGDLPTTLAVPPVPVCAAGMDTCPAGANAGGPWVGASCLPRSGEDSWLRPGPSPRGAPVSCQSGPAAPAAPGLPAVTRWHGLGRRPERSRWAGARRQGGQRAWGSARGHGLKVLVSVPMEKRGCTQPSHRAGQEHVLVPLRGRANSCLYAARSGAWEP